MTLVLKPKGRGRWTPTVLHLVGKRAGPIAVRVGETFKLGGILWRVCRVDP